MADILDFPNMKSKNQAEELKKDPQLVLASQMIQSITEHLRNNTHLLKADKNLFYDIRIVYHLLYATLLRNAGEYHNWHEMMDEITRVLNESGDELDL